jgi:hypothetical protein
MKFTVRKPNSGQLHKLTIAVAGCLFLHLSASGENYPAPKERNHVYLLIGQSNMAGRAGMTEGDTMPIDRCYLLNLNGEWEEATNPLNRYSTIRKGLGMQKIGPGYSFAKAMTAANRDVSIGLIVNAKGGSKIEQWAKGTQFYDEAVKRTREAQKTGTIKGILWHQGESNSGNPDGYLEKLEKLIKDLRSDLNEPDLPVVVGQINNVPAINKQLALITKTVKLTGCVMADGLVCTDRWHFDRDSQILLGQRYSKEMLRLQK